MAITYARAQAAVASGDNTDPSVASFGSAVTEGNLLVVNGIERSGGSADNFVISDNGSNTGWTKRVNETTEQADSAARRTHVVWERVATATDAAQSPFTVSVDDGTANGKMCLADEFTAGTAVTWAFEDVVVANTGTGSTSPLASGSTASTSGTQLLVGNAVWRLGTGGQTNIAFSGLGGVASAVGSNNGRSVASAWAQDETTGTKSTSVSWDGTGHEGNVALLVFSATEPGGGGDATATPGVIAATAAMPAAGVNISTGPATAAVATAMPQPAANISTGPAATALTVTVPQVTAGQAGNNATATPDTIATATALPQPAVNVSAEFATIAAVAALPAAAVDVAASPATTATLVALPQATPDTAGNATASPAAIAALVAMPAAGIDTAAGPAVIPVVAALPAAAASAGTDATASPNVIAAVAAVPLVTIDAGTGVTPAVIALTAALPQPAVFVAAGPNTITLLVTVPLVARVGPPFPANLFGKGHRDAIGSLDGPTVSGAIGLIVR